MADKKNKHKATEDEEVLEGEIIDESPELAEVTAEELAAESVGEDIVSLKTELDQARQKADEYLDGWQRTAADLQNYRRRVERDQQQTYQLAAGNVARRFLDALDDMERALTHKPQGSEASGWADGIELIYRKLLVSLESEGITRMALKPGDPFDPNLEEAITQEDNQEFENGQIIEVVSPGYLIKDRVLRPARVRVAR